MNKISSVSTSTEAIDTDPQSPDTTNESVRLFANAIRLVVQEPDTQEKREVMADIESDLESKHRIGAISDGQKVALLRLMYGQSRIAVYYYDPNKRVRKALKR